MKKRVADIIMDILADNGIEQAFCVVGGGAMFLNNALGNSNKIKTIFNHHEQACTMAAEGYAKTKDKMALCLVTSGPGGTNALTGVMGAYQDSIPMIVISGQVRYKTTVIESGLSLRRRGEQEFDIINSVRNMTKYAKMIIDPKTIKQEVQKAIDIALTGRRGPVWLDIPLDVQSYMIEEDELLPILEKDKIITCKDNEFSDLVDLIKTAKSPCILAGSAVSSTHSQEMLRKVISKWNIPTVSASIAPNNLSFEDELYFGTTGIIGTRCGNYVISNSDLILVLGCSLGFKQTTFFQNAFAKKAKIVMVDVNPDEAKKTGLNIYKYINCDIKKILEKMVNITQINISQKWINFCKMLKNKFDLFEGISHSQEERVNSYNFWKEYFYKEPENNITVLGNNSGICPRIQTGCKCKDQKTISNLNCGSMGYDIPASIGACVALKKSVILVTGDGSFMMNIQELQTIVSNNLPIKIVIFSNDGYRGIEQTCKNYFNGKNFGCTPESGLIMPNFEKISNAFNLEYKQCKNNKELDNSLNWLFLQKKPCLLEILQKYDNPVTPVLKSRLCNNGSSEQLDYDRMYPFIEESEHKQCIFNY